MGCDIGQGDLFGVPMPKGQLIGLMRSRLVGASAAGYAAPGHEVDRGFRAIPHP